MFPNLHEILAPDTGQSVIKIENFVRWSSMEFLRAVLKLSFQKSLNPFLAISKNGFSSVQMLLVHQNI